jgi:hypothetical protein
MIAVRPVWSGISEVLQEVVMGNNVVAVHNDVNVYFVR